AAMAPQRDPLSVRYDGVVHDLMLRAVWASRRNAGVQAWIASPRAEFPARDKGGRTPHERGVTRAAYYLIFKGGGPGGERSGWSLKLAWGADSDRRASSAGRLARPVTVRLCPRAEARRTSPQWVGTARQSTPATRIDE